MMTELLRQAAGIALAVALPMAFGIAAGWMQRHPDSALLGVYLLFEACALAHRIQRRLEA